MTESKWTPGPWRVINADDPALFPSVVLHDRAPGHRPAQITINEGADREALARGEYHGTTMATAAANAYLIAAAPDLYEALRRLLIDMGEGSRDGRALDLLPRRTVALATAACEKANGR